MFVFRVHYSVNCLLQHLSWILGLKPSTGGSLKAGQHASDNPNAVITTAVMADLPVLAAMLSRLFESSQYVVPVYFVFHNSSLSQNNVGVFSVLSRDGSVGLMSQYREHFTEIL